MLSKLYRIVNMKDISSEEVEVTKWLKFIEAEDFKDFQLSITEAMKLHINFYL